MLPFLSRSACNCVSAVARRGAHGVAAVKGTTGIVGLDVVPNAKEVLTKLYEKTLSDIKIIPEGVPYRAEVERFTRYRLSVVQKCEDVSVAAAGRCEQWRR